jgi:uncharacterized protein YdiU (UPF0061 family)
MYEKFKEIDGTHPWRLVSPDGFVDYQARYRSRGRLLYLNFSLAMEMGLLPETHPPTISRELEAAVLETFSLTIINEHDLKHGRKYPARSLKPNLYMATRYLQTQHRNRQGKTSGDGRSIWNGYLKTKNLTFDISSRGTGATMLSPGAAIAGGVIKTGDESVGYASGLAELDEMLGSAVMSEIFYRQNIPTERCLAVIVYPDGTAIGVRSAPNLLRPAHIFRYLKQARHQEVKASVDYFIDREVENGFWQFSDEGSRYQQALQYLARSYGRMAAVLEEEYIFNWLAWDGDNMLASGAILDYGSIRQFAAKHDKYRFKDVDRYSASLVEQRRWARILVKVFAQTMDFIESGRKQNLRLFKSARCLKVFDKAFQNERDYRILWRIGFDPKQIECLMQCRPKEIREFHRALSYFEDLKISKGIERLPDGVTHKPVFLIRSLLRMLPAYYLAQSIKDVSDETAYLSSDVFMRLMAASYAGRTDLKLTRRRLANIKNFQKHYLALIGGVGQPIEEVFKTLQERSAIINHRHRITGDALVLIIEEVLSLKGKIRVNELQEALEAFIDSQVLIPGVWQPVQMDQLKGKTLKTQLLQSIQRNLEEYKESI